MLLMVLKQVPNFIVRRSTPLEPTPKKQTINQAEWADLLIDVLKSPMKIMTKTVRLPWPLGIQKEGSELNRDQAYSSTIFFARRIASSRAVTKNTNLEYLKSRDDSSRKTVCKYREWCSSSISTSLQSLQTAILFSSSLPLSIAKSCPQSKTLQERRKGNCNTEFQSDFPRQLEL